jgi:predicted porin
MNKTSLVALALCAGLPLMADGPSVQVYGIIDTGVAHVERSQSFSPDFVVGTYPFGKAVNYGATGMFDGGLSQSRFGIKASTDLVSGWKAIATLESAIMTTSGRLGDCTQSLAENGGKSVNANSAISGQLFSRGAFAGLSHETFGTLTFGRQQNLMFDIMIPYDANGMAQLFTPIGFAGSFLGGGVTENSRVDSAIKYRVKVADFTVSALYKVSGTQGPNATAATACNEITLEYAPGPFGVYAGYQDLRNGVTYAANANGSIVAGVASEGTIKATVLNVTNIQGGAKFKVGGLLVTAGFQQFRIQDPNAGDAAYFTGLLPGSQYAYGQQIASYTVNSIGTGQVKHQNTGSLTAAYDITSQFKLSAGYYHVQINDYSNTNGGPGGTYNGAPRGAKGSQKNAYTSLVADYAFTKAFDIYAGYMGTKISGNAASATYQVGLPGQPGFDDLSRNAVLGFGGRYKF